MKSKIVTVTTMLAFLSLATGSLQAQGTKLLTITATVEVQGDTNDNGTTTTIATPTERIIDTKQILEFLAVDENAAGNYASTNFPSGAKLVVTGDGNNDYQVLDNNDDLLVDVTNILILTRGTNVVVSGKISNGTGLNDKTITQRYILRLDYDDSSIIGGVGLQFFLEGLTKRTVTDTAPNKAADYTETILNEMPVAMGAGNYQGVPFVISGNLRIDGSAILTLSP